MRQPTGATKLAAVIGDPIRHSLSPVLHNTAFEALGLDWVYVALHVPAGAAPAALEGMRSLGLAGLSVTMPHKVAVAHSCDDASDDVVALGAANTVVPLAGGRLRAESTDGPGFVAALRDHRFDPAGRRCMVIGAGGAGRAVVLALVRAGAREIVIVNRDRGRAEAALALTAGSVGRIGTADAADSCDLVVNATPQGMAGDTSVPVSPLRLGPGQVVNDLVYHPETTPLLAEAAQRGATIVGGIGMLLHQAACQIALWTGEQAPIDAMRVAVEQALRERNVADVAHLAPAQSAAQGDGSARR